METTETMQMPVLGEAGDPCPGCSAPLAADQRYCLNCGHRRSGPRVDYRTYLAPAAEPLRGEQPPPVQPPVETVATASPEEPRKAERDFAPLAAVGGIALLGLMLLVGVLIGRGSDSPSASPPQVIKVGGSGAGEIASAPTDSDGEGKAASQTPTGKSGKGKDGDTGSGTGAKTVEGGLTGDAARQAEGTVQASTKDLETLEGTTGEDYENAVKKLPDKIATPGAPPPIDKSKAPGGGSGGMTIE